MAMFGKAILFRQCRMHIFSMHKSVQSKQCRVVLTQIWVKYGQTKILG